MPEQSARKPFRAAARLLFLAVPFALALAMCACGGAKDSQSIRLCAGAGLRRAVAEVAEAFEKETGVRVDSDYAGSGMLLTRVQGDPDADLFMPGDVWYVDRMDELTGLVAARTTVSYFVPVIITQKGNPHGIRSLEDLFQEGLVVALGKADSCQIGRITAEIFEKSGLDATQLQAKESLTVNELGVWVKMQDVDAAIVWDAIARNVSDSVDIVEIPRDKNIVSNVAIAQLKTSRKPELAARFIEFITGETGQAILKKNGYRTDAP